MKQLRLLKNEKSAYGGELLKTRDGRSRGRPLDTKNTMHLVLRSTKAKGEWSFRRGKNPKKIESIISKFAIKYGVRILSLANVGNHLHLQLKLSNRFTYAAFIRAITAAIAMAVTGASRWNKMSPRTNIAVSSTQAPGSTLQPGITLQSGTTPHPGITLQPGSTSNPVSTPHSAKLRFWDYRPFTRVVASYKGFLNLRDYIRINQLEGQGYTRGHALYFMVQQRRRKLKQV